MNFIFGLFRAKIWIQFEPKMKKKGYFQTSHSKKGYFWTSHIDPEAVFPENKVFNRQSPNTLSEL